MDTKNDSIVTNEQAIPTMSLDAITYNSPLNITGSGKWIIEIERAFCYATPNEGEGDTTIQLHILANLGKDSRETLLNVIFPDNSVQNYSINLQQKGDIANLQNKRSCIKLNQRPDNKANDRNSRSPNIFMNLPNVRSENKGTLSQIEIGYQVFAVGCGYDINGEYASPNSVKLPIVDLKAMAENKNRELVSLGPVTASFSTKVYTGSSASELSNKMSVNAKFGGKYCGFSGEIGSSFNTNYFSQNNYEYALTISEVALREVCLRTNIDMIISDYMLDEAYYAINGLKKNRTGKIVESKIYSSTPEGFRSLIREYGTHFIMKAQLGGRMKYGMTIDVSKIEGAYDLNAYANASYKNSFINTSASISEEYKESYKKNSSAYSSQLNITGGGQSQVTALSAPNGDNDANVMAWKKSLNDENLALVGLDFKDALIPLYELVDKDEYPERYEAMKNYMTSDQIANDFRMIYDCGTITRITIPKFDSKDTLVQDVYLGGQNVAKICNEYIPVINKKSRVTVIYPVLANRMKLNMGYFIGDKEHKPGKICWEGNSVVITEYANEPMRAKDFIYLRGSSFFSSTTDTVVSGKNENTYLVGLGDKVHYPIVKVLNNFWMKEDYREERSDLSFMTVFRDLKKIYFYSIEENHTSFLYGKWKIPEWQDFRNIINVLDKNNVTHINIAEAFLKPFHSEGLEPGVLGLCMEPNGHGLEKPDGRGHTGNTFFCLLSVDNKFKDGNILEISKDKIHLCTSFRKREDFRGGKFINCYFVIRLMLPNCNA